MMRCRRQAAVGALGSLAAHASLLGVLVSLPMPTATPSSTNLATDGPTNSLGRGFPGRSNHGPGVHLPKGDADVITGAPELDPAAAATPEAPSPEPAAERILEALRPVIDYRNWPSQRIWRHLVESTLVALVIFLLTVVLRRSSARLRYALWFLASMKFFVPFAALVGLGAAIGFVIPPAVDVARPFTSTFFDAVWMPTQTATRSGGFSPPAASQLSSGYGSVAVAVWLLGVVALVVMRVRLWMRVKAALRASEPLRSRHVALPPGLELRSTPGLLEPGVIGWQKPVLLLPRGIVDRLSPAELRAVIAHECCHVRRRDNLTALLHMLTETVFWFHPAVWLIGSRLLVERERACDEAVLAEGHSATTYAQAIVSTCAISIASPVACVSGVTGSKLAARIDAILRSTPPDPLRGWRRVTVLTVAAAVVVGPISHGAGRAAPRVQQTPGAAVTIPSDPSAGDLAFEAASIRLNTSGLHNGDDRILAGGRYTATNLALGVFIRLAYTPTGRSRALEPFEVKGGPDWLLSDRFDISATAGRNASEAEIRVMLRSFLAERFRVQTHVERRMGPVFRMSLAKAARLGPQLRPSEVKCGSAQQDQEMPLVERGCGFFGPAPFVPINSDRAYQALRGMTMEQLAVMLSAHLRRPVINSTGLSGTFDGELEFTAEIMMPPPPLGPNPFDGRTLPSIFSVLPDQLGLRLEQAQGPVDTLVIDRAERPTPN